MNTRSLIPQLLVAMTVLVFSAVAADAATLDLDPAGFHQYQQTDQSPCIFVNPSCDQGAFVGTDLDTGGNVDGYNEFSPVYSGATLLAIIGAGNDLLVGFDINEAAGQPDQTLSAFYMLINGFVVDSFVFAGSGNVPAQNNGNGYADYVISGFSTFIATDTVQFHLIFNDATDGTENLFIVGTPGEPPPPPIPEPASLLLLGSGLAAVAASARKRMKKA